jgi:hypothetical protein
LSKSRQKGTSAETDIVQYLESVGIRAKRNPLAGSRDVGDIDLYPLPVVIEVKNCKEMKLSEWIGEAETERDNAGALLGVVWHKRVRKSNPEEWYVTMDGKEFTKILLMIKKIYSAVEYLDHNIGSI